MTDNHTKRIRTPETVSVRHIQFDKVARKNLAYALKVYISKNMTPGEGPDFNSMRRVMNDWLLGKSFHVEGLARNFPESVHENFFKNLCPTGNIDDIHELNTYAKQPLMLHVLATFLEHVEYLDLGYGWLTQSDHAMDLGYSFLKFIDPGNFDQPVDDIAGLYLVSTDFTTWRRYPIRQSTHSLDTQIYYEDFSSRDGSDTKKPALDNRRELGVFSVASTSDNRIFDVVFREAVGRAVHSFKGTMVHMNSDYKAFLFDREGNDVVFNLGILKNRENTISFFGAFLISGIYGEINLQKQNARSIADRN